MGMADVDKESGNLMNIMLSISNMAELAAWTLESDRVLVF